MLLILMIKLIIIIISNIIKYNDYSSFKYNSSLYKYEFILILYINFIYLHREHHLMSF